MDNDKAAKDKNHNIDTKTEDVRFLNFAKNYVVLLTGIASIPLLSSALDILKYGNGEVKLNILSSFLCLITFASCFSLRGVLGRAASSEYSILKIIPFFLSCLFIILSIYLTSIYLSASEQSIMNRSLIYLLIYPLVVLSLGITLVTSFTQQIAHDIQSLVDAQLNSKDASELHNLVKDYVALRSLVKKSDDNYLQEISHELIEPFIQSLKALSQGKLDLEGNHMPQVQGLLLKHYGKRFDASSDKDLNFWLREKDVAFSKAYFQLNIEALRRETIITRIFILSNDELKRERKESLIKVLKQQHEIGIGWAICIDAELGPEIKSNRACALDFALFDHDQAVSFFRDYREPARKFSAVLRTDDNKKEIENHIKQHRKLTSYCIMANSIFKEDIMEYNKDKDKDFIEGIEKYNNHIENITKYHSDQTGPSHKDRRVFLLEARDVQDIPNCVNSLIDIKEKIDDWYGKKEPTDCRKYTPHTISCQQVRMLLDRTTWCQNVSKYPCGDAGTQN